MNPTPKLAPASAVIAGAEAPLVAEHAEVLHLLSPTHSMPGDLAEHIQNQVTDKARFTLELLQLPTPTGRGCVLPFPERRVSASAALAATKGIARSVGRASAAGAMVDGAVAAVEAAVAYSNDQASAREALAHVGREAATGAVSAAAGTAAVAALVVVTGPVSAPVAALVGTAAAVGARSGFRKGAKKLGKGLKKGGHFLLKLAS